MENKRNFINNQQGFTLVEIIAVLVILGILAAVAVPKFIDMQDEARERAVKGALAAASSNVTLSYSQFLIKNGKKPTGLGAIDYVWAGGDNTVKIESDLGDFTATYEKTKDDEKDGIKVNLDTTNLDFNFGSITPEAVLIPLEFGEETEDTEDTEG